MRRILKKVIQGAALLVVLPLAATAGFGRVFAVYLLWAQALAMVPGFVGNFLRAAYYRLTLAACSQDITIAYGAFFSRRTARVAPYVSIGSYCVIGNASIGTGCQISSLVQIPSGKHDHPRDAEGKFLPGVEGEVRIGDYCFIAASAIVLANVGDRTTIGAGSVVVKDLPSDVVAVGNPARVISPTARSAEHGAGPIQG
jgi:acetyltransferase-like isoleucine patch superfamily enzyme